MEDINTLFEETQDILSLLSTFHPFSYTMNIDPSVLNHCTGADDQTVMMTLTNKGYLLYTLNMLKSLRPYGLDHRVLLLCLDRDAAKRLAEQGYSASIHCLDQPEYKGFRPWNSKGYDHICYLKLSAIHWILSTGRNVWLIDGDIVFRKDPLPDIKHALSAVDHGEFNEVWIQNDGMTDQDRSNLCTGYVWIRSTELTRRLFDCTSELGKSRYDTTCALDNNDQTFINYYVLPYLPCYGVFPLKNYPNGAYYYRYMPTDDAILVHFNWVRGHLKMAKMKEHRLWLLNEAEEDAMV